VNIGKWRLVVVVFAAVLVAAGVRHAWTCISGTSAGVHFNTEMPDFGAPPQVASVVWWKEAPCRPGTFIPNQTDWDREEAEEERIERLGKILVKKAREADAKGNYRRAIPCYKRLIAEGIGTENYWRDRVEVLEQALRHGAPVRLAGYLDVRNRLERGNLWPEYTARIRKAMESIAADPKAGFLRPHALYTVVTMDSEGREDAVTARRFAECAELYPGSPRAQPALIMAARTLLQERPAGVKIPRADLAQGRAYLSRLLTKYPHTRFRANALGWAGRVEFLMGRYDSALVYYRRQMAAGGPPFGTTESIADCYYEKGRRDLWLATYIRHYGSVVDAEDKVTAAEYVLPMSSGLRKKDMVRFCRALREDMGLLQPYLELRLYYTETKPADLANLVRLGEIALRRHPKTRLSPAVLARLSEISYLQKRYRTALKFAAKAIDGGGTLDVDLAWFVRGSAQSKLGRRPAALRTYETFVRRFPKSRLVGGARENLALLYEKGNRLPEALTQYLKLDYELDVAYMLDVRMSPEQVASFVRGCSDAKTRKLATYALGMRYLRRDRFNDALRQFAKLTRRERREYTGLIRHKDDEWWDRDNRGDLQDPVVTANKLKNLHAACRAAKGPERKAKAVYALAAYYYNAGDLLLYNKSLWDTGRAWGYGFYWNKSAASPADVAAYRKHCYEHETYARARALCLEVLHRYPHASVAPKAAYTAANACYHLSGFNPWWREEDGRVGLGTQGERLMTIVYKRYPKSPLAKSARKYADVFGGEIAERERYRAEYER
jgi:tetratricopeptide (TPR) repeat protein